MRGDFIRRLTVSNILNKDTAMRSQHRRGVTNESLSQEKLTLTCCSVRDVRNSFCCRIVPSKSWKFSLILSSVSCMSRGITSLSGSPLGNLLQRQKEPLEARL